MVPSINLLCLIVPIVKIELTTATEGADVHDLRELLFIVVGRSSD